MGPDSAIEFGYLDPWKHAKRHAGRSRKRDGHTGRDQPECHPEPSHSASGCTDDDSTRHDSRDNRTAHRTTPGTGSPCGRDQGAGIIEGDDSA